MNEDEELNRKRKKKKNSHNKDQDFQIVAMFQERHEARITCLLFLFPSVLQGPGEGCW